MGHKRRGGGGGGHEATHGGDRPWVYFMVDCFFLITEFFVLTFKFKQEESVLPQRLPPGGTSNASSKVVQTPKENLMIHVSRGNSGSATYTFMQRQASAPELYETLARAAGSGGDKYSVRVSYDADVQWGDVMGVFNACNKVKIAECGLIPLRGRDR